ncbi:MAG: CinA family protein [Bacteroidales bacterium]|nr:CinA family protein [Bacteroidales bacterium]
MKELVSQIKSIMLAGGKTLATAESCTGGGIAAAITSVSGASEFFQGGLVAYQNSVKIEQLGVQAGDIEQFDVVSCQVAQQMVRGACRMFGTDYALASTGYAQGGSDKVAAGTIWIAWGSADEVHSLCLTKDRGREENVKVAINRVLEEFLDWLLAQ